MKRGGVIALAAALGVAGGVHAQSLEERLDHDLYVRSLVQLDLPDVLAAYLDSYEPTDPIARRDAAIQLDRLQARRLRGAARDAALDEAIDARRELLAEALDHPRAALWRLDLASDLLLEVLPRGGASAVCLIGRPSDSQRARAEVIANEAIAELTAADEGLRRLIRSIERQPGYADDVGLQLARRQLANEERDRRLPLLRGIANLHRGAVGNQAAIDDALRDLDPLRDLVRGPVLERVLTYAGLAYLRSGQDEAARARFDEALITANDGTGDGLLARIGLAELDARGGSGDRALEDLLVRHAAPEGLFARLLVTDVIARGATRPARAVDAYINLLEEAAPEQTAAVRTIVLDRLPDLPIAAADLADLPALVTIGWAERALREDRADEAVAELESARARRDLAGPDQAALGLLLGQARAVAGDEPGAIDAFMAVGREHPRTPEARRAVRLAADLARRRFQADDTRPAAQRALRAALDLRDEVDPDAADADRWHYLRGRLAMREGRWDDARAAFDRVPASSPLHHHARHDVAVAWRTQARRHQELGEGGDAVKSYIALRDMSPQALEAADAALRAAGDDAATARRYRWSLRLMRAEALLAVESAAAAIAELDAIGDLDQMDAALIADALRLRIAASRAGGAETVALDVIERYLDASPDQAVAVLITMMAELVARAESLAGEDQATEADRVVSEQLAPLAELVAPRMGGLPGDVRSLRLRVADARRLAGRHEDALADYDRLATVWPNVTEVVLGRAECLFASGETEDLADAMRLYKRLAGGEEGDRTWWLAQLRMLQILDRVGRNTDQIGPRIERLRLGDPTLGGPAFRRQFGQLER